jgi:hypothetical protein
VNKQPLLNAALVLLLIALPLVSVGMSSGPRWLGWIGAALLAVGGHVPIAIRLVHVDEDTCDARVGHSD